MAQPYKAEFSALRSLLLQARDNLTGIELPQGRAVRSRELLEAALALVDDLAKSDLPAKATAAQLGAKGGKATAKRMTKKDPDYYKRIAGMRRTKAGGRPRKGK
jgi:hypothetical protein